MKVIAAKEHFEKYLSERGLTVEQLDAENAVVAMCGFYLDVRADGVEMDRGGDMLLFDWGTYEWDDGQRFQYCITRQFLLPGIDGAEGDVGEDDGEQEAAGETCWQLALTLYYDAGGRTLVLDAGERICASLADLNGFLAFVDKAAPTNYARRRTPTGIRLDLDEVE